MTGQSKKIAWLFVIVAVLALAYLVIKQIDKSPDTDEMQTEDNQTNEISVSGSTQTTQLDFASLNATYRFSGRIPSHWQVEYVAASEAVNVYDPSAAGRDNLEKSQIFIRYFQANNFLTLSTVDILNRQDTEINGHAAIHYEIRKKETAADFANQPSWRSRQHKLVDIRFTPNSPSLFYVVAYNPELDQAVFNEFVSSIFFHNDLRSLAEPITGAAERVTKKPFGLRVSPVNSPVSPEKFSGFHTGVDFETTAAEAGREVQVAAICGGRLMQKRTASGYGGLAVQECEIGNQPVRVIYGHLDVASISHSAGDYLVPGQVVGILGEQGAETDGERKHLHLGIYKGTNINIRGYVQSQTELSQWLDYGTLK